MVTGLILTSNRRVSLGRALKRRIKSMVFKHRTGPFDRKTALHLSGLLSYANSIEPTFIRSLEKKFGAELKDLVQLSSPPPKP